MTTKAATALLAITFVSLSISSSPAQTKCEGHVLANGDCVNASAAASARRSAVILSQPKISETAYPVLPSSDGQYRYPNQLNPAQNGTTRIGIVPRTE